MADEAPRSGEPAPAVVRAVDGDLPAGFAVGEYRIERVLGRGGMGVVYAALQPTIEKKVAIKVLSATLSADRDLVRRFVDEARAVNRIGHENIIDIFSFGQLPDGRQYFVMEYLEGATLADHLAKGDLAGEDLPLVLVQICEALEAAHAKKIIHRDLKPENVWVAATRSKRNEPRVRLLDFGIAKLLGTGDRSITDVGVVMGTPHFMSPEQCHGRGVDHRSDLYALGVMMYKMFTGRLPFTGETYAEILVKQITLAPPPPSLLVPISPERERLIMRCLEKEPAQRPQSAAELGAEVARVFNLHSGSSSGAVAARPPGDVGALNTLIAPEPPRASAAIAVPAAPAVVPRRVRSKVVVAAVVVAAGAGLFALGWQRLRSAPPDDMAPQPAREEAARPRPEKAPPATPPAPPPIETAPVATPPIVRRAERDPARVRAGVKKHESPPAAASAPAEPAPAPPAPPAKRAHERAKNTGLVTDNPFE